MLSLVRSPQIFHRIIEFTCTSDRVIIRNRSNWTSKTGVWQCLVARFDSALDTRTSLARLGIVVLSVFPTQSSLLALRIPSMSKYSAWFL